MGTEAMVKMAREAGVKRYLQMSALGTRPNARSQYHQTKWVAEEAVRGSGLSYTIFRPSIIFGAQDRFMNLFSKIIDSSPILPIIGSGNNRLQPIWVENVVDYFIQALERDKTEMKTYELGGPRIYSMEGLMDLLMKIKGKRRPKIHLPLPAMRFQAALMESFLVRSPLTRDQLLMLEEDNIVTDQATSQNFSVTLASLEEVLPGYLKSQAV
jgi:NADH dehydrogenase